MSFSLALAVDTLSNGTFTRRRIAAGAYNGAGVWVAGAETSTPDLAGSITPLPDREIQKLPGGDRARGGVRIITTEDLRTLDRATNTPADRVVVAGRTYEVAKVGDWSAHGFVDALALEVEP